MILRVALFEVIFTPDVRQEIKIERIVEIILSTFAPVKHTIRIWNIGNQHRWFFNITVIITNK